MASSSLSSVVSSLVRAQMGSAVLTNVDDADLDRHVADLILKEAKEKAEKYKSENGIRAYLPGYSYEDSKGPRTNKRFLSNIIRNTDDHNRTIIRAQAESAAEMRAEKDARERAERRARAEEAVAAERARREGGSSSSRRRDDRERSWERRKHDFDDQDYERRPEPRRHRHDDDRRRRYSRDREERDDDDRRRRHSERSSRREDDDDGERRHRSHRSRHHSRKTDDGEQRRRRRSRSPGDAEDEGASSRKRRRHRSRTPEISGRHDSHSPEREAETLSEAGSHRPVMDFSDGETQKRNKGKAKAEPIPQEPSLPPPPGPPSPPPGPPSPPPVSRPSKKTSSLLPPMPTRPPRPRFSPPPSPKRSKSSKKDRPPEPPAPAPPLPPMVPSKMDKYFEDSYDPRLDVAPLSSTPKVPTAGLVQGAEFDGWEAMLEVIKERRERKALGLDKVDKKSRKSETSSPAPETWGGGVNALDIAYKKRGATREWDLCKETPT